MIEDQLDEITAEIGGIPATLLVRVYLKDNDEEGNISPEGHIPSSSYIANNVLTLYTESTLKTPSYFIPPPMVRFIEVIRKTGGFGVKLISWTQKIPAIRVLRDSFKFLDGEPCNLIAGKQIIEAAPTLLVEGLDKDQALKFMILMTEGGYTSCCLVQQGIEVD